MDLKAYAQARFDGIGAEQYGPYDPATDTRDLVMEQRDEVADAEKYRDMMGQKYPRDEYPHTNACLDELEIHYDRAWHVFNALGIALEADKRSGCGEHG